MSSLPNESGGGGFRKQGQQVMEKNGKKLLEKQKLENYGVL